MVDEMTWAGVHQSVWITWSLRPHLMFGLSVLHCGRCSPVVSSRGKEWPALRYVSAHFITLTTFCWNWCVIEMLNAVVCIIFIPLLARLAGRWRHCFQNLSIHLFMLPNLWTRYFDIKWTSFGVIWHVQYTDKDIERSTCGIRGQSSVLHNAEDRLGGLASLAPLGLAA